MREIAERMYVVTLQRCLVTVGFKRRKFAVKVVPLNSDDFRSHFNIIEDFYSIKM